MINRRGAEVAEEEYYFVVAFLAASLLPEEVNDSTALGYIVHITVNIQKILFYVISNHGAQQEKISSATSAPLR